MSYRPGSFSDVFNTQLGQELWTFLNKPDNVVRMETATYLARPAAEPLAPGLLSQFGAAVRNDRIKQMIGNMIRQIIEPLGYHIDRQNVRIPPDRKELFTSATRYKPN